MSLDHEKNVHWDGRFLTGSIVVDGKLVNVSADREVIHQHAAGWNDALMREIGRNRGEIFEKLTAYFAAQCRSDDAYSR